VFVFIEYVVLIGHVPLSLLIMGADSGIDNYRLLNYLSAFCRKLAKRYLHVSE